MGDDGLAVLSVGFLRHAHFAPFLATIGLVLILIGFAATDGRDRPPFLVFGVIVLMTAAALWLGRP